MTLQYVNPRIPINQPNTFPVAQTMPWGNPPAPYGAQRQNPYYATPVNNGGPSLSAVKIDINGASMDTGGNAQVGRPMPMYPGRTQAMNFAPPQYYMPQSQPMPIPQQPQPASKPTNQQAINTTPPPAIDKASAQPQVDPQIEPLAQAIKIIAPDAGQQLSLAEQEQAIYTIGQYAKTALAANQMMKTNPKDPASIKAEEKVNRLVNPILIEEKVFKGLTNIITSNTSGLSGAEKEKADSNKIVSMWTLAMLQKIFRTEMDEEIQKRGIQTPPMPIGEIPGVSQIVEIIKSDLNPEVRESGIVALMEVADPENQKDIETVKIILQTAAEQDSSEDVKITANNAAADFLTKAGYSQNDIKKVGFHTVKK